MSEYHESVLLKDCIDGLNVRENGIYVDATFGGGGHSREIMKRIKNGKLFGFDQDKGAEANTIHDPHFVFINQNFRNLRKMLQLHKVEQVDGILADLGISSYQVDSASRGFAYRLNGPLDMRMNPDNELSATNVIQERNAAQLQQIFSQYGEVRNSKTLAQIIVKERAGQKIDSTEKFVSTIEPAIKGNRLKYLAQVFQALRIEVNDEINALKEFMDQCGELLKSGGRLVVISFHSIEDRIVKNFIRFGNAEGHVQKDFYGNEQKLFSAINKKPIRPTTDEITINPRSHSARLRIAEKL